MTLQFRALYQEHPFVRRAAVFVALLSLSIALSAADSFAVNPVPLINQPLVPTTAVPGGAAFTLTVNGTGFVNGATVNWNGSARTTTFVSGEQLTAAINAGDIAVGGTASLTVFNPTPGGGTSNVVFFQVTNNEGSIVVFANAPGSPVTVGLNPYSVAVGDFNGDGKPDLAVANNSSNTVSILLGNGDGTFTPAASPATGGKPYSVAVGDFNGDGKPDLAVANYGSNTVSILLGNGDGTFTPAASPATGSHPDSVAVGDFNGDGKLDLAVANLFSGTVTILLGNGDGTFTPAASPATGTHPYSVAVGDFNGDGKLDLAVANRVSDNVTILLGNGDGTFTPAASPATGTDPISVAVGDFNGDGKLDLAVTADISNNVIILLGNGDGTFTATPLFLGFGSSPGSEAVGDFNGDGKLDLAVADYQNGYVIILLGDGTGNFTATAWPAQTCSAPISVAVGDFNRDGRLDLTTACNSTTDVFILPQGDPVTFSSTSLSFGNQVVGSTSAAQTVTLTNNQNVTLNFGSIVASGDFAETHTCGAFIGAGGTCTISVTFTPTAVGNRTGTLTINDDAPGSPQTVSLSGTGVGTPVASLTPSSLSFSPQSVGTTSAGQNLTLSNTGNATLTITSIASSGDFAQSNNCAGFMPAGYSCTITVTFTPTVTGTRTGAITVTDDSNGVPGSTQMSTLSGTGAPAPNPVPLMNQPLVPDSAAPGGAGFTLTVNGAGFVSGATVDWNGSPRATVFVNESQVTATINTADIAVAVTASVTVLNPTPGGGASNVVFFPITNPTPSVFFGNAPGSPVATGNTPYSVAVGDFNGDGKMDLAIANLNSNTVTILLGNGDGIFTPTAQSPATGLGPIFVAVGDFNGDGKLDLAVANFAGYTVTILLGNGDGTFTPTAQSPATGSRPNFVAVGDFNGDGKLDLAVSNQTSNNVTILLGNGDGTFTPTAQSPATGTEPISVAVGDFNGDGKLDLAVANFDDNDVTILLGNGDGTFTPTAQSPSTGSMPDSVAVADFNGDGKLDLAVANGGSNTVTILLGNGDGTFTPTAQSPATGDKPFSVAAGDLNGDGKLDLAVGNFNSNTVTILLGNGDGTFTPTAQSPATGNAPISAVVGDFNGDGRLDLAVANNNDNTISILLQAPSVSLSTPSLSFGAQNVNTTSAPQTETVTNTGTANLTISTVTVGGTNASDFATSADTCTGATVAPSNTCTVSVTFTPSATGSRSASLNFTDNASDSPESVGLTGTGVATNPVAGVYPPSLTFGSQIVGTMSASQPVTLSNTGTGALTITNIAASANFGETNNCGGSVAAGGSCTINVTFSPTATGPLTGTLTITDNSNGVAGSTQTVTLTGTGTAPLVSLSAPSLSFGNQLLDTTSAAQTETVTNTGTANLTISAVTVGGTNASDFAKSADTCTGATVTPSSTCTVSVTFTPSAMGSRSASLNFADNASNSPQTVTLSGTGTAPVVSLSAPSLSFGNQLLDTTSAAQTETVTNSGTANLSISTVTVGGTNASDFAKSADTCTGATVTPNGTCTVSVTFTPAATGARSGTLTFTDNNNTVAGSTQTVNLSGTGGGPVVSLSAPSMSFGSQPLSTTSAAQTETVTNTGTANLSIATVTVGGTNASDFAKSADTCTGATVAPNGTCTVSVTFTPAATGTRSGTLTFTDNNNSVAGSTQAVTLSGVGVDFAVATPTGTQTVAQGGQAQYTINVTSVGGTDSNAVTLACSNLPAQATCAFGTNPVTPGASGASSQLTITTTAPAYAMMVPPITGLPPASLPALLLATMLPALVGWWRVRRKSPRWAAATCLLFGALLATTFMAGCGAGGYPLAKVGGTPVGTYSVTVSGTSGSTQHTTTVTLTVNAS